MSHNLKIAEDGSAVFASTEREWHQLGQKAERPMTVAEALELSGLGRYTITEQPLTSPLGEVATHKAIYLDGDTDPALLGVVGINRRTFQPAEMLEPLNHLAGDGRTFETAGMLGNGGVWFATVRFPEEWTINGDSYTGYLFGRDSADGSSALDIRATMVRVVCQNTFNCALSQTKGAARYTLRHTANARISVAEARRAIGLVPQYAAELDAAMTELYAQDFSLAEFHRVTDHMFGLPDPTAKTSRSKTIYTKRWNTLENLWTAPTQDSTYRRGGATKLTAFQAMAEYLDWHYGSEKGRMDRVVGDDTARLKAQVLALL